MVTLEQFFVTPVMKLQTTDNYEKMLKIPFIVKLEMYQNDLSVAWKSKRNFKLHVVLVASENDEINYR